MVTYVVPIFLIGLCSVHMSVVLWLRPPVGVITPQLTRARRKKQKVRDKNIAYKAFFAIIST